ncbi:MAG TPA: hypothetical protein VFD77_02935 [Brumimicrobium sp.]|nr:hypothetical protein [Brumimicrobium sp.]
MRILTLITIVLFSSLITHAQLIATVEMKEKVEGICDNDNVYGLFDGFDGQVEAKCSVTKEMMQEQLNQVLFLKNKPKYKGKGMVGVYINCKGEAIGWRISVKTNKTLDEQLMNIFQTYLNWTAGTLNGEKVDSSELISYKIKKGKLTLN